MRAGGKTGAWQREWLGSILAAAILLPAAPAAWSVVQVADPRTFPHAAQHARITALFDGKPLAGATVKVEKYLSWDTVVSLATDSHGEAVLPELPDGFYQIVAWSSLAPGFGAGLDVCIGPCLDAFKIVDLTANSLDGDLTTIDEAASISEFSMDVGPFPLPLRADLLATVEGQPVRTLQNLRGAVVDPTGTPIPGAWIGVVRQEKQGDEEIALLRTDDRGAFAAKFPEGHYIVLVTALAFEGRAIPIAVLFTGDSSAFQVALKILPPH